MAGLNPDGLGRNRAFDSTEQESLDTDKAVLKDTLVDAARLGDELTIRPNIADKTGSALVLPSGSDSRSHWLVGNNSDPDNFGGVKFEVDGTDADIEAFAKGTGNIPATLNLRAWDEVRFKGAVVPHIEAQQQSSNYWYAAEHDGSDPDTRLDNALANATDGDVVFLENIAYDSARTGSGAISKGVTRKGTNAENGTKLQVEWELSAAGIEIECMTLGSSGQLNPTAGQATIRKMILFGASPEIDVGADYCLITECRGGEVTFQSGTSNGLVDSCLGTSVTDNGTNSIGDT